ncbi:uncharacterized protein B0H18DRAFT_1118738 [Fomitopsis serialis]|uniref:uncharacterized protein n=1 Tax=Fomitopsis serialis TaxID=139415 RepID=UPI002008153A|nr:uncharacterized protein B0H18DRAFT_1118738 [Neoantrodia serialis]KAH9926999.1 hypothetical protein B0H18DRAFT_1118738 [Neoantrodia serialis]
MVAQGATPSFLEDRPPITDAPPPFNKPTADVILRSSDFVDFHVRKGILAEASDVFDVMFLLPQPPAVEILEDTRNGKPVILFRDEESRTLERLLRLCYPGRAPSIGDLDDLRPVIHAAVKYDMPEVLEALKETLRSFMDTVPIRVYAIALIFKFEDEAKAAAKASLAFPAEDADAPELAEITGKAFNNLLKYHRACGVVAARVANNPSWIPLPRVDTWFNAGRNHSTCARAYHGDIYASEWWTTYMAESARILKTTPSGSALLMTGRTDQALRDAAGCLVCKYVAPGQMRGFIRLFADEVDKAIAQVSLDIE